MSEQHDRGTRESGLQVLGDFDAILAHTLDGHRIRARQIGQELPLVYASLGPGAHPVSAARRSAFCMISHRIGALALVSVLRSFAFGIALPKVALSQLWVFVFMGNDRDLNVNGSALPPILELKTTRCGLFECSNGRIS